MNAFLCIILKGILKVAFHDKPPLVKNLVLRKKESTDVPNGAKLLRITIFY